MCRAVAAAQSSKTPYPHITTPKPQTPGFFTQEALRAIADTTLTSVSAWAQGQQPKPALIYKGQAVGNVPCAGGKNVQAARIRKEEQEAAKAKATAAAVAGEGK